MQRPETLEGMAHLGYPLYFTLLLGFWKMLEASPCWRRDFLGSRSGPMPAPSLT